MDFWELLRAIEDQYPHLLHILAQPGIFDILVVALNPETAAEWPRQRVEAAVQQTPYYKNTPESKRLWDLEMARDPATAAQTIQRYWRLVEDAQNQLGITLPGGSGWDLFTSPFYKLVEEAAANNWSFQEIKYHLSQRGGFGTGGGEIETNAALVKKMSDDYGVPFSDWTARVWGTQLARGTVDNRAVAGYLAQQAKSLYPGIASLLDKGFTVREIAAPYINIAQQELGINPETVSFLDPKWNRAIHMVDPSGNVTAMSLSDWVRIIRSDPVYGYDNTIQARKQASQFATGISQLMGALG